MRVALARVDYWASAGRSPWHEASAWAKLVLALATVCYFGSRSLRTRKPAAA